MFSGVKFLRPEFYGDQYPLPSCFHHQIYEKVIKKATQKAV